MIFLIRKCILGKSENMRSVHACAVQPRFQVWIFRSFSQSNLYRKPALGKLVKKTCLEGHRTGKHTFRGAPWTPEMHTKSIKIHRNPGRTPLWPPGGVPRGSRVPFFMILDVIGPAPGGARVTFLIHNPCFMM